MTKIFLNYRRADNSPAVSLLRKNLEDYYEPEDIFQDLESIPKGAFFWKTIEQGIRDCDIQLVVIGPRWLAKNEQGQRRIDDPNDYVRREIELGMSLPSVRVVPVFIDGATPETVNRADPLPDSLRGAPRALFDWLTSDPAELARARATSDQPTAQARSR